MQLGLEGKKVLITGGSHGIGLAIAQGFAEEGCQLFLAGRNRQSLQQTELQLQQQYRSEVHILSVDLGSADGQNQLTTTWPEVDILINNAGAIPAGNLAGLDNLEWRQSWELKLFGYIALTRFYYARMCVRQQGVIVNIIGVAGERPFPDYIAGSMANSSLMAMTCALGSESPSHQVRVVGVNPGFTETGRLKQMARDRAKSEWDGPARDQTNFRPYPFGRPALAEEIAASVVFLASPRSSYTSGTILTIDGGWSQRKPT